MKILFVSGYDSMNYTLAECAKEAIRRGHEIKVVVKDSGDRANCGMYETRGIGTVALDNFDCRCLDDTDIVITSPVKPYYYTALFDEIHARGLFVIAFSALFSSIVMREYPDLVLCLGDARIEEFDRNALKYSCISVGNPQYDPLVDRRRKKNSDAGDIKRVLIVDQGGYPYGSRGKTQLAGTLKAIAENDPERIYEIKQRYNGRKAASFAHEIPESLEDYMTDLPENLCFLKTDKELEELLPDYDAMITTWSTAFIDAAVMNIPLVLISGLHSQDRFDVRRQRTDEAYGDLKETGCVRDYLSLRQGRISFSYVDEAYKSRLVYKADSKSAPRVLNLIELLYEKVIGRGLRINRVFQTDYESFINNPELPDTVSAADEHYILKRRFLTCFNDKMQEWVYISRCMGNALNLGALKGFYEPEDGADFERMSENAESIFQEARDDFFKSADAGKALESDRVLQDFYFDWLYDRGMYGGLADPETGVLAPESRYYNLCMYELDRGHTGSGLEYLEKFLNTVYEGRSRDLLKVNRLQQCMLRVMKKTGPVRFALFAVRRHHVRMTEHFNRALVTDYALTTAALMHVFLKEKRFDECTGVYRQYSEKKKRRGGKKRTAFMRAAEAAAGFFASCMYKRSLKAAKRACRKGMNNEAIGFCNKTRQCGIDGS